MHVLLTHEGTRIYVHTQAPPWANPVPSEPVTRELACVFQHLIRTKQGFLEPAVCTSLLNIQISSLNFSTVKFMADLEDQVLNPTGSTHQQSSCQCEWRRRRRLSIYQAEQNLQAPSKFGVFSQSTTLGGEKQCLCLPIPKLHIHRTTRHMKE